MPSHRDVDACAVSGTAHRKLLRMPRTSSTARWQRAEGNSWNGLWTQNASFAHSSPKAANSPNPASFPTFPQPNPGPGEHRKRILPLLGRTTQCRRHASLRGPPRQSGPASLSPRGEALHEALALSRVATSVDRPFHNENGAEGRQTLSAARRVRRFGIPITCPGTVQWRSHELSAEKGGSPS